MFTFNTRICVSCVSSVQMLSNIRDFGLALIRPVIANCYDEKPRVSPIKAATQKKRRDGVAAAGVEFVAGSSKTIPAG